jgi:hypothetical protein
LVVENGDDEENSWTLWDKGTCKNVSTPNTQVSIYRGNKECEIGGINISYLGIMYESLLF